MGMRTPTRQPLRFPLLAFQFARGLPVAMHRRHPKRIPLQCATFLALPHPHERLLVVLVHKLEDQPLEDLIEVLVLEPGPIPFLPGPIPVALYAQFAIPIENVGVPS